MHWLTSRSPKRLKRVWSTHCKSRIVNKREKSSERSTTFLSRHQTILFRDSCFSISDLIFCSLSLFHAVLRKNIHAANHRRAESNDTRLFHFFLTSLSYSMDYLKSSHKMKMLMKRKGRIKQVCNFLMK